MKQCCFIGNHSFDGGITPELMTQEEMMEFLSHSTGWVACRECSDEFMKNTSGASENIEEK